ncbi:NAD(P)-dependent oxidoreductase [Paenibacillus psychroresistens]|uniref:NAD(P)-dependent oxidoreductase n=1 Tax=Paenibacillus psychroresistens TaxID=1778678 RepID=A0A6B8RT07_9BACL|nr:NAD(P)-dependent oxidoreductase [Paenibacillus psychroresistens]QGQ98954.1 NAD(P)-dependent oxidoreductase [Paenibacillus psychroresistens]
MKSIAVTGASGKLGSWVVNELLEYGYRVIALDQTRSNKLKCEQRIIDLTKLGEVIGGLKGVDAVIHLAAIPAPVMFPHEVIFNNNVMATYNVLEAVSILKIPKVVIGSSESAYGFCWAPQPFSPLYLPVDEEHPLLPQECYGLSKEINERTGAMFNRRAGTQVIAMRFSLILTIEEYAAMQERISKPENFKRILWSYIDIRDAAAACRIGIEADDCNYVSLNVTANDTLSDWETNRLLAEFYSDVTDLRCSFIGREAVVSNELTSRILNWRPRYSWKESLTVS